MTSSAPHDAAAGNQTATAPAAGTRPSLVKLAGLPFLVTALIGRLPAAMIQLGLLLYLSSAGAGLAQAGLAVACLGVGSAVGGPIVGHLIDRISPVVVVVTATAIQVGGLLGLVATAPGPVQLILAALIGAANPQVGAIARGHWARLARDRRDPAIVPAAMGWEGAADEVSFVAGPAVAGILIGALGAVGGLLAIVAITVVGQLAFVAYLLATGAHRRATPRSAGHEPVGPMPWARLAGPAVAAYAMGIAFGMTQTGLTARFDAAGTPGLTGPVYALLGVGSAIGSLAVGRLPLRFGPTSRIIVSGLGLAAAAAGLVFSHGLVASAVANFFLGLFIGPIMVTAYAWAERHVPRERLTAAMTVLSTGVVLGVSTGAGVGSRLAEAYGVDRALWLTVGAGGLAVAAALAGRERAH
ncbi:MFS transporter [Mariniluteicoccus flavus]